MNKQETLALFAQGRDAWNAWAEQMLAKRAELEKAGQWVEEKDRLGTLEPRNDATKAWFTKAEANFAQLQFPADGSDFSGIKFPGDAWFSEAAFAGDARFSGAAFAGDARFDGAAFAGDAWFDGAAFAGDALFDGAKFAGDALFDGAKFSRVAWFDKASFAGNARFAGAKFSRVARFERAAFSGTAQFDNVAFSGAALFEKTAFAGSAWCAESVFLGDADFREATFSTSAGFGNARFKADARFGNASFDGAAWFAGATFERMAGFDQVTFKGFTTFTDAKFLSTAGFDAVRIERAFTMANATFHRVPDFIQAHFEEAPRLDNVDVLPAAPDDDRKKLAGRLCERVKRRFRGDPDEPARWRALKRLAIQGHDGDREQMFFAGEIKSARLATDFPLPFRFWRREAWAGFGRYWFGWMYQAFSNFGRSLARPIAFWLATMIAAWAYMLAAHPDVAAVRERQIESGVVAMATSAVDAWLGGQACYAPPSPKEVDGKRPDQFVSGLTDAVRNQTSAATEALHLAFRNAFIILDGGSDAAHRIYGCLYGIERYGDTAIPVVPTGVSFASAIQKALSGVFIFLFGLGLRNMLKMK